MSWEVIGTVLTIGSGFMVVSVAVYKLVLWVFDRHMFKNDYSVPTMTVVKLSKSACLNGRPEKPEPQHFDQADKTCFGGNGCTDDCPVRLRHREAGCAMLSHCDYCDGPAQNCIPCATQDQERPGYIVGRMP